MSFVLRLLDILIPRFITEEVACIDVGDHLEIMCSASDLQPGEHCDSIVTVQTFNLLGFGLFPKVVG